MTLKEAIKWIEASHPAEDWNTNGFFEAVEVILKKVKSLSKKEKFNEEFGMEYTDTHRFLVESDSILQPGEDLFERFGLIGKIKIKARKGKIVIEKIK